MVVVSDLIGVKYKEHGRTKEEGFDCYGLVLEVMKRLGYKLPDFDYLSHTDEFIDTTAKGVLTEGHAIRVCGLAEGVIILFENSYGFKHHIAVYLGDGMFIHCNKYGVHLDRIDSVIDKKKELYIWQN